MQLIKYFKVSDINGEVLKEGTACCVFNSENEYMLKVLSSHPYGQSKEHANQVQTEFLLVFLSVSNIPVSQVLSQVGGLLQQNEISRFLKGTSLFPHQDNMGYISCVLLCIATGAADAKTHTSPLLRQHSLPPFQL